MILVNSRTDGGPSIEASSVRRLRSAVLLVLALFASSSTVLAKCGEDWLWLWEPDGGPDRPCETPPCGVFVSAWHGELDFLQYHDETGTEWYIYLEPED